MGQEACPKQWAIFRNGRTLHDIRFRVDIAVGIRTTEYTEAKERWLREVHERHIQKGGTLKRGVFASYVRRNEKSKVKRKV